MNRECATDERQEKNMMHVAEKPICGAAVAA